MQMNIDPRLSYNNPCTNPYYHNPNQFSQLYMSQTHGSNPCISSNVQRPTDPRLQRQYRPMQNEMPSRIPNWEPNQISKHSVRPVTAHKPDQHNNQTNSSASSSAKPASINKRRISIAAYKNRCESNELFLLYYQRLSHF